MEDSNGDTLAELNNVSSAMTTNGVTIASDDTAVTTQSASTERPRLEHTNSRGRLTKPSVLFRRETDDQDFARKLDLDMAYYTDEVPGTLSPEPLTALKPSEPTSPQDQGWLTAFTTATKIATPWFFGTTISRTSSIDSGSQFPNATSPLNNIESESLPSKVPSNVSSNQQKDRSSLDFEPSFDEPFVYSAFMLAYWDNLVGPKIEKLVPSEVKVSNELLLYISRYTLNSEIARPASLNDPVENKFSVLGDQHIAVASFIFSCTKFSGPPAKHALCVIIPETNIRQFLLYYPLIQNRILPIIDRYRILQQQRKVNALDRFSAELLRFSVSFQDLNLLALSSEIKINETIFGPMYEGYFEKPFLRKLFTSFLQTHGFAVIVGNDVNLINVVVKSLALLLSPSERKRCRLAHVDCHRFMPELLIQGLLVQHAADQLTEVNLLESSFPITVADIAQLTVQRTPIYHEYCMVRKQWLDAEIGQLASVPSHELIPLTALTPGGLLQVVKESAPYLDTMLAEVAKLPYSLRWTFLTESKRLLVRKAVALIKYSETEIESVPERMLTQLAVKKIRSDLNLLENNIFWAVLAIAEKLRPGSFADVMEDPISMEEKFRAMIESF